MQTKALTSVNSQLENSENDLRKRLQAVSDELILYKGPIPDAVKPTLNDINMMTLTRAENALPDMGRRCK